MGSPLRLKRDPLSATLIRVADKRSIKENWGGGQVRSEETKNTPWMPTFECSKCFLLCFNLHRRNMQGRGLVKSKAYGDQRTGFAVQRYPEHPGIASFFFHIFLSGVTVKHTFSLGSMMM
jgi:hypothetical protein